MNNMLLLIGIYAIIGTAIALYSRGAKTQESFFIGDRSIGGVVSALTYASTTFSAFMMVGLVGLAYATGVGALGFELVYLVGTLFFLSFYGPRVWKIAKEKNVVSPSGILEHRYGLKTVKTAAIISLIALIPYTSVQLTGVALILEQNASITYSTGIIIIGFLVALWAFLGGLRGVALTDSIQGILMICLSIATLAWVTTRVDFSAISSLGQAMYVPNPIWTPKFFLSLTIPWFFFALTNPQVFQRMFISKDLSSLRKMIVYFGLFGLFYTVIVTLIGIQLKILTFEGLFPLVEYRDNVMPILLSLMPEWLSLLVALSIIAAAVSTANSIVLTLSSMVSKDIVNEKGILYGKVTIILLTLIIALFAVRKVSYIVELSVLSSTILLCLLPLVFGLFHSNLGKDLTGILTILSGFFVSIALTFLNITPLGVPIPIITLAVSFSTFLIVGKIEAK